MKLRAPAGCITVSHQSSTYVIAEDGSVDVGEDVGGVLQAHGFAPWHTDSPVNEASAIVQQIEPVKSVAVGRTDEIADLNRPALFAFLKAKGVSVSLPITNDELRGLARGTLQD
jgi:hypothetical protein